jgi:hypothetical protein
MPGTRSSTSNELFTEEMKLAVSEIVEAALERQTVVFSASIQTLTTEISDLKSRLTQKDFHIQQLKIRIEQLEAAGPGSGPAGPAGDTSALTERIAQLEFDHDALEQYGRRMNIRLDNVPELANETPDALEKKALELLSAAGAAITSSDIIRMHRIGRLRPDPDQPQSKRGQVIIRLSNWKARESAHLSRNKARDMGHPIRQDLTQPRRELIAEANAAIRAWDPSTRGNLQEPVYCYANINCVVTMRCGRNTEKILCDDDLQRALEFFKPQ